jgi:hypothetical protein
MLAARAVYDRTGEERFAELWRESARALLAHLEPDGLWTQDLYGQRLRYLGAGHGFAGNVRALFGAPDWLVAFLAVFARTRDERWLERARAFATHAIAQAARLRAVSGRGRYTLFTGDLGAALLAAACITLNPAFPGIDDL